MDITNLETPVVLVDLDRLDRNLRLAAETAKSAGVKLRPHFKTHKSVAIAKKQIEYGACGITVAKIGEAEILARAGIRDILIAFPIVGEAKLRRVAELIKSGVAITLSVDSVEVARGISQLGESLGAVIPLYVDVNTGLNRCGHEPGAETAELVKRMSGLKGIRVQGLMTHGGHSYGQATEEGLKRVAAEEVGGLVRSKELLEEAGIHIPEISVGSTPTSKYIALQHGATETRPGAYVYGDGVQLSTSIVSKDELAMTVMTTVVSTPRDGTVIVDGGSKTFSTDVNPHRPGYGIWKDNSEVYLERLSEEHGIVRVPPGLSFSIGDKLEFIPNHCCTVSNLHNELQGVRNGQAAEVIHVDARGQIR
ncbi:alanine racemase [Paenibacillus sp. J5C_2022]|uniref:alanine racemase n=1 Tax=Paenibacillus sp. J5C2022 TaxID=2977129 RepID=UPI0021CF7466|nr:alanine racemase [Paenibacillus sp. J5C2022]MCU6712169.1 alanine racemase [Paenibacillus sp. J5C2022]